MPARGNDSKCMLPSLPCCRKLAFSRRREKSGAADAEALAAGQPRQAAAKSLQAEKLQGRRPAARATQLDLSLVGNRRGHSTSASVERCAGNEAGLGRTVRVEAKRNPKQPYRAG